ncbi:ATP-binding protein [Meiothermus sp.]|uniref:ATP-binding protein n=1 Tax=Meiothermus sp. TaxID=1955249 RepID=UPI00307EBB11
MDPIQNPYSPGAGAPPPELVGRDQILDQAWVLLGRVRQRRPEKSVILTGLRGVGKTVLLNEIERIARQHLYHTLLLEALEDKPLGVLLSPHLRTLLYELDRLAGAGDRVKRALAVLRSFVGAIKVSMGDFSIGLDIEPAKGSADSGDIEIDLPNLFVAVGEAAEDRKAAVALLIDEVQYFSSKELGALIMAMHKVQQRQLPIVLIGAGLPILAGLAGESRSYAERLFAFLEVGALSEADAMRALAEPAQARGVLFEPEALREIYELTKGYPYFLQVWGYWCWNLAERSPISLDIVRAATTKVITHLDQSFFRVRFDRLTPGEKDFLRAMAELGQGPYRVGEVAGLLEVKTTSLSPVRAKLIKKGMIYSPAHGEIAFTVPLFDQFMRRVIPEFKRR